MPGHVAVIMDGNGRWAKARGLPRVMGHRAGVEALKRQPVTSSSAHHGGQGGASKGTKSPGHERSHTGTAQKAVSKESKLNVGVPEGR